MAASVYQLYYSANEGLKQLILSICENIPNLNIPILWKLQKPLAFFTFSGCTEMKHWAKMGKIQKRHQIISDPEVLLGPCQIPRPFDCTSKRKRSYVHYTKNEVFHF